MSALAPGLARAAPVDHTLKAAVVRFEDGFGKNQPSTQHPILMWNCENGYLMYTKIRAS